MAWRIVATTLFLTFRAAASGGESTIRVSVGGESRQAIVVNAPTAGTRRPAVLVLHGGMGSAEQMRRTSGFDRVARDEGFMVRMGPRPSGGVVTRIKLLPLDRRPGLSGRQPAGRSRSG